MLVGTKSSLEMEQIPQCHHYRSGNSLHYPPGKYRTYSAQQSWLLFRVKLPCFQPSVLLKILVDSAVAVFAAEVALCWCFPEWCYYTHRKASTTEKSEKMRL